MEELRTALATTALLLDEGLLSAEEATELKKEALLDFHAVRSAEREKVQLAQEAVQLAGETARQQAQLAQEVAHLAGETARYENNCVHLPTRTH